MGNIYCSACGNEVIRTMKLCPSCGQKNFQAAPPNLSITVQTSLANRSIGSPANQHTQHVSSAAPVINAPASIQSGQQNPLAFTPAPYHKRLGAALIDVFIVTVATGIPIGVGYAALGSPSKDQSLDPLMIVMILASLFIPYLYYSLLHSSQEMATIGKRAMSLVVVTNQGERLTRLQAFIRIILTALLPIAGFILLVISAAGLATRFNEGLHESIGVALVLGLILIYVAPFMTVFFNKRRQTLFDMLCGTSVICKP